MTDNVGGGERKISKGLLAAIGLGIIVAFALLALFLPKGGAGEKSVLAYGGSGCERPYCYAAGKGEKDVVVTGDSHGRMLYAGLKQELGKLDIPLSVFDFDNFCQFYNEPEQNKNNSYICVDRLEGYLDHIQERNVETIVLAFDWMNIGSALPFETRGDFIAGKTATLLENPKMASVKTVVFAFPVPGFENGLTPQECAEKAARDQNVSCDSANVDSFKAERKLSRLMLDALRRDLPKDISLQVENPFRVLCSADRRCKQNIDAQAVYSDANLLSVNGSRHLVSNWRVKWKQ